MRDRGDRRDLESRRAGRFVKRELRQVVAFEDFRAMARRRLPHVLFDSIDGGAGAEVTLRANCDVFNQVCFRPQQASAPTSIDLSISLLGECLKTPVLLAPCGSARMIHPDAEPGVARAASGAGTVYVVPHLGGTSCERIREQSRGPLWYQIYRYGGREMTEAALRRAWSAGFRTLVVTIDNARTIRERDARNGFRALLTRQPLEMLPHMGQILRRPGWFARFIRDGLPTSSPNAVKPDGCAMEPADIAAAAARPDAQFHWDDFGWIRALWPGPVLAKGVLTAQDASRALSCGVDGIIVSNHGGRTLDGLEPTLRALPEVVAAVPSSVPVLLDSGIRRGSDVIKALCLGAKAVLIGRPYMFALSGGEPAVARLLALFDSEMSQCLAALGCASPGGLGPQFVRAPAEWMAQPHA